MSNAGGGLEFELWFDEQPKFWFRLEPRALALRTTFGTSHSSTSSRTNAIIHVKIGDSKARGFAEIGLPPKKPGCYEANFDDVMKWYSDFSTFAQQASAPVEPFYDPFTALPPRYFATLRASDEKTSKPEELVIRKVFCLMDSFRKHNDIPEARPSQSGLETALLDAWASIHQTPLYRLIQGPESDGNVNNVEGEGTKGYRSFYTVGLNADIDEMVRSLRFGLTLTSRIKIKINNDCELVAKVLKELSDVITQSFSDGKWKWTLDANSSWESASVATKFIDIVKPYATNIYAIEQPFPQSILETSTLEEISSWVEAKKQWNGLGITFLADETVRTHLDVKQLAERGVCDGVNIKVEKAGGIRGAVLAAVEARSRGLGVWLGMMVASRLGTAATAHLLPFATDSDASGDLDGAFLVVGEDELTEDALDQCIPTQLSNVDRLNDLEFVGGFRWSCPSGLIYFYPDAPGLGMKLKQK